MHTVIILNKHSSDLLKDFRFLFKPFVDQEVISFCDWNESGKNLQEAVPDLYKAIKGKKEWRAIVVNTDSTLHPFQEPQKNPFDFCEDAEKEEIPHESEVPLIRLTHMLCGYPASAVKNFEKGYEYEDVDTGLRKRVRASEFTEQELFELSEKYRDGLKPIYMEEEISEELVEAEKMMKQKYLFVEERPRELCLVATRRHPDDEEHIYDSWKAPYEIESSDFCSRNHYPTGCRFLCYDITNAENSRYTKELAEFWLSVLTLSLNKIPASTLQAYKLYRLGVQISQEEMSQMLNTHLNKLEAAYTFVLERIRMKPNYSFEEEEEIVQKQHIPVIFEGTSGIDLYISTKDVGLSRDCPEDELRRWREKVKEKKENVDKFLKSPRRAIDKASQHMRGRAESFQDDEYELDKFQIEDLKREMDSLELEIYTSDTKRVFDEQRIKEEIHKVDKDVKKDIAVRMRRGTVIGMGCVILFVYLIGYFPYLIQSVKLGGKEFLASFGLSIFAVLLTAVGGVAALLLLRKKIIRSMERFNDLMRILSQNVNDSAKRFESYFTVLCTYMKAQSIYKGTMKNTEALSDRMYKLKTHKQALKLSVARDEELANAFGIRREADFERNIMRIFREDILPMDNPLYYFEVDDGRTEIPLNTTGEMVKTPYKFIAGLKIEREDLYEEAKGEDGCLV